MGVITSVSASYQMRKVSKTKNSGHLWPCPYSIARLFMRIS